MQLKLLALLGALAPIANAQNKTVVPQNNTLVSQNNTIVITDNLVDIINNFPSCSLPCFSDAIHLNRCRVKELDCVCHWALVMSDDLTPCTRKQCKGSHNGKYLFPPVSPAGACPYIVGWLASRL